MIRKSWLVIASLILILAAAGAYFWATAIMDSLMEFRSPLAENPPAAGEPLGDPLTERVVIILVDALREDTALDPEVMPYLDELRQQSAWATMRSLPPSYSSPGWTTLLTGARADINDSQPANPPDYNSVRAFTQDNIFAAADRAGMQTAVSGFGWFEGMLSTSGVDTGFYTPGEDHAADLEVLAAAQSYLQDGSYQLVLIHLDQVDYAGHHEGGPRSENWTAAAARVDTMIETIVSQLDLEKDTVLVLSDHGQIDRGGHGGQDPITLIEPFLMAGKGVIPGSYPDIQMVEVAPTVAVLLGLNLPASGQGRALTEMLDLTLDQTARIEVSLQAQQSELVEAYLTAIGQPRDTQTELSTIQDYQNALKDARSQRLAQERLPRAVLALLAAAIPAGIMIYKRSKNLPWLIGGAVLYLAGFNLIYAVIVGKTYSLSSVYSADDLILSTAMYAGIAILAAWLVFMLGSKAFSKAPASAARQTLNLGLVSMYLLALPVIWNYFWNGPVIVWTLPEFNSMFLAFLSIVQVLFVSVLSLVLAGIAAGVAKISKPRSVSAG